MPVPFIVYADFESFTPQLSTCQSNPERSYSKQYQKHIHSRFCYRISCEKNIMMTIQDKLVYDHSTLCHIYNEELGKDRVCDHCHLSGKFSGAAHEVCNLKYTVRKFFPVAFHNLSGFDSHLFLKHWEIAKEILLVYQIMKNTAFLVRNRSSLTNLLTRN